MSLHSSKHELNTSSPCYTNFLFWMFFMCTISFAITDYVLSSHIQTITPQDSLCVPVVFSMMNTRKVFLHGKCHKDTLPKSSYQLWFPLEFQYQVHVSWFDPQDSFNVVSYDSQIKLLINSVPNTMVSWVLEWTWIAVTGSWASCFKKRNKTQIPQVSPLTCSWWPQSPHCWNLVSQQQIMTICLLVLLNHRDSVQVELSL